MDEVVREVSSTSVEKATLSEVLSGGDAYQGKRVHLDDVLQIGNVPISVKGRQNSFLRVSLKKDGVSRLICTNNGQIEKYPGAFLFVDEAVSGSLTQLCSKLGLALDPKPEYYAELEVTPNGSTLLITALDLVLMNTLELAQGRFQNSFLVFHVSQSGAEKLEDVDDGYWYRRLGGKGLSAEWRIKFNKEAIRKRNDVDAQNFDRVFAGMLDAAARRAAESDFQMRAFAKSKGF
jgi:hypothetical protein